MKVPHNGFVLVADGQKALLLRNQGDAEVLDLKLVRGTEQSDAPDRDRKTDAKGRAPSIPGIQSATVGEADYHQQAEDRFAADTADALRRSALAGDFEHLIVVAPPRTLGELRKHYHKEVVARLTGEIPKDLTDHTVPDIERALLTA
ncbi:MAG TPA: host attachment family protein [Sphingomonadaceae bacterium]|nr:host attachment family protein [Sphingomonadaceae bacterium]